MAQMAIWEHNKLWVVVMVGVMVGGVVGMGMVNRRAMWAVRELMRVEGAGRSVSIGHLCESSENGEVVAYY